MKRFLELSLALMLFCFPSCTKEKLIIDEVSAREIETPSSEEEPEQAETKPLIVVSPDDVIEILVRADGAPGMYLGEDGEVHGFYVDLEKMVMKEMGQAYHFYPYSSIADIFVGFKSGIYHSALSTPDVPDYQALFDLSIPYEILHYVTFVRVDNNEIKGDTREEIIKSLYGKKVGVQTQGHIYQALRDYKEIELVEYETTTKALEALNAGLLDAVPDVKRIGEYYRNLKGWNIKPVGEPIINHEICTSFSKALDPSLVERYDKALKKLIDEGKVKTLWESYFGPMAESDIP
ncbi:substrate-binding periplasmic protein [Spirochaeta isovalerica]|uniref:ABC-type amino acid transport substrate-binding protein n=1 Tax=Spirochaeta isovalerica TaxID=150 RepID=A0A841R7X1_9SPIO|nr:transporter substrate-binding domain-containing protein [Spirochaeta isovalerica]MBB6479965.1 ABC-type amino acid transport substrate-binding protein [Spirochaeta isovalerica]